MSRKHYYAIAKAIASPAEYHAEQSLCHKLNTMIEVLDAIGTVCYEDNDRFDYDKFVTEFLDTIGEEKLQYYRCQDILRNRLPKYATPRLFYKS